MFEQIAVCPICPPPICSFSVCCFRPKYQLNVKWMCTCFRQADWPCSQAWVSLVHSADRHRLKCQGLAVCWAPSTGRGLSLRNVMTLNKQQHSSDILYPSVQRDPTLRSDWVWGLHILTKLIFPSFSAILNPDLIFLLLFWYRFIIFFLLPLNFPSDSPSQSLKISFSFPPHNSCSRPAVNCLQLNEKTGGLVIQRNQVQSSDL